MTTATTVTTSSGLTPGHTMGHDAVMPDWYERVMNDIEPGIIRAQIQQFAATDTHRQPYSYLKNAGALTGRDRNGHDRFESDPAPPEKLPKVAAIIGTYLIREYQRCGEEYFAIDNLSAFGRIFNLTTQKLKRYLVILGGHEYFTVELVSREGRKKRVVGIQQSQLFHIDFYLELEDGEMPEDILDGMKTGTPRSWYAHNRRVVKVRIQASERFRNELHTHPYA